MTGTHVDLSSGLPLEKERSVSSPPTVPLWSENFLFALYDAKSLALSLRRSADCQVDLSRLATALGGGGHAAAAGAELPELRTALAEALAARVAERLT